MFITDALYNWLGKVRVPGPKGPAQFKDLPDEVVVDFIFDYLHVKEILRARRVCKSLYQLSHQTIVWKRLLRRLDVPCPPVPPTSRYSYANLTGFEAEQMVIRGYSLDAYWKRSLVKEKRVWDFKTHHHVLHACLLPGSHYMVASVADECFLHYYICVFTLIDTKWSACILAKTAVPTKAFHIVARYMTVLGKKGIAIAFVRRDYQHDRDRLNALNGMGTDISMFSADYDVDSDVRIRWEAQVLHIPLDALETLADPRFEPGSEEFLAHARAQPPPFRMLAKVRTSQKLGIPSLDEIYGLPYFAIPQGNHTIVFKNLDWGASALLHCLPTEWANFEDHKIMGIRLVGAGNVVLVARSIRVDDDHYMFGIESFEVLQCLGHKTGFDADNIQGQYLDYTCAESVRISEYGIRPSDDNSILSTLTTPDSVDLRPIGFYVTMKTNNSTDRGILHLAVFPTYTPPEMQEGLVDETQVNAADAPRGPAAKYSHWTYPLVAENIRRERFWWQHGDRRIHVLPGSHRNIIYHTDLEDRMDHPMVKQLYRIYHPVIRYNLGPIPPEEDGDNMPKELAKVDLTCDLIDKCDRFAAVAWDETIGRLVIAHYKDQVVYVVDYASTPCIVDGEREPIPLTLRSNPDIIRVPKPAPPPAPAPAPPEPPLGSAKNPLDLDMIRLDDPDLNLHVGPAVYLGNKPREIRTLSGALDWLEARAPSPPAFPPSKRRRVAFNNPAPRMPEIGEAGPSNWSAHSTIFTPLT